MNEWMNEWNIEWNEWRNMKKIKISMKLKIAKSTTEKKILIILLENIIQFISI